MSKVCPCCGQQVMDEAVALIIEAKLPPLQTSVALVLCSKFGRWVRYGNLVESVYADDPDGGPLTARQAIQVHLCHLRRNLRSAGLEIETYRGFGYRIKWTDAVIQRRAA
ncbi:MAG: winged helix-turn-helix domain-containing protein [Methyloceanibacter sp.]